METSLISATAATAIANHVYICGTATDNKMIISNKALVLMIMTQLLSQRLLSFANELMVWGVGVDGERMGELM